MRTDRYHQYGLTAADEPFRRAIRDGFRQAGLSHKQFLDALTWYRDHVVGRPGMDESALSANFDEFARNKGWDVAHIVDATSVHAAIQAQGPQAVMAPTPTPEDDKATIERANQAMRADINAWFKDEESQDFYAEALERQQAAPATPVLGPPVTDAEIERRMGRRDVEKFEKMLRDPQGSQLYWRSPEMQAQYRDALEQANLADEAPPPGEQPVPTASTPTEPVPPAPVSPVVPRSDAA
jgi:hypothetical protein